MELHARCCGVDRRNREMELIPASGAVAVKLWVSPPWGVCLALQLKDGQQRWSWPPGICESVRMGESAVQILITL